MYAKVYAYNAYGNSLTSSVGGTAKILTIPIAPVGVSELYSSRTATTLGLQWALPGVGPNYDGGSPVISY